MMRNRTVSTLKPMNWIGFRPHLSMKRNVAQYPGTRPASDRIRLPRLKLRSACQMTAPASAFLLGEPNPMAPRMMDELRPRP